MYNGKLMVWNESFFSLSSFLYFLLMFGDINPDIWPQSRTFVVEINKDERLLRYGLTFAFAQWDMIMALGLVFGQGVDPDLGLVVFGIV